MEAVLRRGPVGLLPADDLRHARPLPPRGRADREADAARRGGGGAARGRLRPRRRRAEADDPRRAPRRLLPGRRRPGRAGAADRLPPDARDERCTAGCGATRTWCSSAASLTATARGARRGAAGSAGPMVRAEWLAVLLLGLIPANDIAVNVVNQLVTAFLPPRLLPEARPARARRPARVPHRRRRSPPCSAASRRCARRSSISRCSSSPTARPHLHFALLSDFTDAAAETRAGRRRRSSAAAVEGVRALNARYAPRRRGRVLPLPSPAPLESARGRVDGMGAEARQARRVQPLRAHAARARRSRIVEGDPTPMRSVRYVITLDADTVLPPDAAPLLVGALAHPLNRAVYDPRARARRARLRHPAAARRRLARRARTARIFAAIHSGHPGVDPYTTAVSDVYQDLYGEGSFTGKGIYDVDAFERATHGRFPENTLLSHDLIEGTYARAGLVTDIERLRRLPDALPHASRAASTAGSAATGSCCRWLTAPVPGPGGPERNRLSLLSRWKIFDNLRRSTVEIAQLAFLVAGWTVLPGSPLRWTAAGPRRDRGAVDRSLCSRCCARRSTSRGAPTTRRWAATRSPASQQFALAVVFLPHQAWVSADAIVRTLWRLAVSHRHLLEWQTASQTERGMTGSARVVWRGCGRRWRSRPRSWRLVLAACDPAGDGVAWWLLALAVAPLVASWLASPSVAHALGAPAVRRERRLAAREPAAGAALRAAALALLRPVRHRRDALARARQLPGDARADRRAAHVADQHRAPAPRHGQRVRPRLPHARRHAASGSSSCSGRSSGCGASAATSTTGTTCGT